MHTIFKIYYACRVNLPQLKKSELEFRDIKIFSHSIANEILKLIIF